MANYPSHKIHLTSDVETESQFQDDFSQGGIQHSAQVLSQPYYRFTIFHNLTLTELNSLFATYDAGPRDEYTFNYDAVSPQVTYTVKFLERPQRVRNLGKDRFIVRVLLRGTKD